MYPTPIPNLPTQSPPHTPPPPRGGGGGGLAYQGRLIYQTKWHINLATIKLGGVTEGQSGSYEGCHKVLNKSSNGTALVPQLRAKGGLPLLSHKGDVQHEMREGEASPDLHPRS